MKLLKWLTDPDGFGIIVGYTLACALLVLKRTIRVELARCDGRDGRGAVCRVVGVPSHEVTDWLFGLLGLMLFGGGLNILRTHGADTVERATGIGQQ